MNCGGGGALGVGPHREVEITEASMHLDSFSKCVTFLTSLTLSAPTLELPLGQQM